MKLRLILTLTLVMVLAACGGNPPAPATTAPQAPAAQPTTAPAAQPTSAPPTQPPPTTAPPANTAAPAPTEPPPAPTNTTAPQPTDTVAPQPTNTTAAATPAATRLRPTPTSAGPLTAAVYVANCRSTPTTDKPGRVTVQISVEAKGGNGRYRYFYQGKEYPTKFIEVIGEKGTRIIDQVKVTSGDGQEITQDFDISIDTLTCP